MKEEEMITIMKSIWVLTVVLFLTTTALAQDQADLILTGGKIATLSYNEGFVDSLAVKDGFVYATGTDKEVQRFKGPETRHSWRPLLQPRTAVGRSTEPEDGARDGSQAGEAHPKRTVGARNRRMVSVPV
jgi:hypothetical protein